MVVKKNIKNKSCNYFNYSFYLIVSFFILFSNSFVFAQNKQAAIWHIGNKKMDFNTNPVTVTDISTPFLGTRSSIALADSNGVFLLFASTQTSKLYNSNLQEIINGNINVGIAQQRLIFIPQPSNSNLVYLVSPSNYTLIDVQNNIAIENNIPFGNYEYSYNNIYAVHHANCNDIWLIVQKENGFYSHLVSNTGISNLYFFTPAQNYVEHRGSFSSTGRYFINLNTVTNNGADTVLINFGGFNRVTGELTQTNSHKFKDYSMCFSSAFSPDETKLYLFMQMRNSSTYHVYQTNILNGVPDFANSIIISTQSYGGFVAYSSMQVGINGKIYQTFYLGSSKKINIIHNPNILGISCNYEDNVIPLTTSGNNTPLFISTWFSDNYCILDFFVQNNCLSEPTNFTINNTENIQSVLWDFGNSQTSTELEPTYTYINAGVYTVTLTATYNDNSTDTVNKEITIYEIPTQPTIFHD